LSYCSRHGRTYLKFLIPEGRAVLEVGCGSGDTLAALRPARGVGLDWDTALLDEARRRHEGLTFEAVDDWAGPAREPFDYVVLSNALGLAQDAQALLARIRPVLGPDSRLVIRIENPLWRPLVALAARLRLRRERPPRHWFSLRAVRKFLALADCEIVRVHRRTLMPVYVPVGSTVVNRLLAPWPLIRRLCQNTDITARPVPSGPRGACTVSVIVPARNERGTIEEIVRRVPEMGAGTELVFVEGGSRDGTREEIRRVMQAQSGRRLVLVEQDCSREDGKGPAVRQAFDVARGDILMILDADLSVRPEELPRFYDAVASGKAELANGTRLVYPMESGAMRFLNRIANRLFGRLFTFLLDQDMTDTLCGTKVLRKVDYERIKEGRSYFGNFDPFGDFDLLFGAARLGLKCLEVPVHYKARTYGSTNISRFRHGFLLFGMCGIAFWRLKAV
jgi:SAM-dependent methyltransferase